MIDFLSNFKIPIPIPISDAKPTEVTVRAIGRVVAWIWIDHTLQSVEVEIEVEKLAKNYCAFAKWREVAKWFDWVSDDQMKN